MRTLTFFAMFGLMSKLIFAQTTFIVNSDVSWQNTGINLVAGDKVLIIAEGIWDNSTGTNLLEDWRKPDGYPNGDAQSSFLVPQLSEYALIGKIGQNGTPFPVGSLFNRNASISGELYLALNDSRYDDNFGYLVAFITTNSLTTSLINNGNVETSSYGLSQNYPNPFNPSTTIRYSLSKPENISIKIYDLDGQLIKDIINEHIQSGVFEAIWDGTNNFGEKVSSGAYFYQISVGDYVEAKKMILIK